MVSFPQEVSYASSQPKEMCDCGAWGGFAWGLGFLDASERRRKAGARVKLITKGVQVIVMTRSVGNKLEMVGGDRRGG